MTARSVEVREVTPADAPELADLLNAIIARGGTTALEQPFTSEALAQAYLVGPDVHCCLVALDPATGQIAGFQTLGRTSGLPDEIGDIATFARIGATRRGIGTALFAATRARAAALGLHAVSATIRADNEGGLAFYTRQGFTDHAVIRAKPLRSGRQVDRIVKRYILAYAAAGPQSATGVGEEPGVQKQTAVGNPRFFRRTGPHRLAVIAAAASCAVPDREGLVSGLASLSLAGPDEVSFAVGSKHAAALAGTRAGAVLVRADMVAHVPPATVPLVTADPMASWTELAALFHPAPPMVPGIHPSAVIAPGARIDPTAQVCAQAVIEDAAEIGPGCRIGAGSVIGEGVVLGPDCRIGPQAGISHAVLGARVTVYPGARIGQEGFGFSITPRGFLTMPQLACVIIEDDVEIGANTTIDRGALTTTVIGAGTRIDNLVQVGHGVKIGRYCAIAGMVGFSGSVELGDFVEVGGQACFTEHVRVGSRCRISAQSLVIADLEPGSAVFGSPARPVREAFRELVTLKKLAQRKPG